MDAALNNYVALHYASRHMSWLHCMWGVGTIIGPSLMSAALTGGHGWSGGYLLTALVQGADRGCPAAQSAPLGTSDFRQWLGDGDRRPFPCGRCWRSPVQKVMLCFFGYCALESTAGQWAASYLTLARDIPAETAAGFAALFYLGITAGRAVSGWIARVWGRRHDPSGALGHWPGSAAALLLPGPAAVSLAGLVIIGLGCAPIYPSIIHFHPGALWGAPFPGGDRGTDGQRLCGQHGHPPVWADGPADHPALFPFYLLVLLGLMAWMHHRLVHKATPFTHSDPI